MLEYGSCLRESRFRAREHLQVCRVPELRKRCVIKEPASRSRVGERGLFVNAEGGRLFIGVTDNGVVTGVPLVSDSANPDLHDALDKGFVGIFTSCLPPLPSYLSFLKLS